ncbi:MAG: MarR family transcriptional regulator [Nitriliruptor sp.]|nr:MAG: MarR family transcriptional regulator [Nitriliruptor sp.]
MQTWTFLTTHGRTMLFIARHPDARLRDIAESLDVTERTVTATVRDLTDAGYVIKHREGRRNRYEVQRHVPLHDVPGGQRTVADLLQALGDVEPNPDADLTPEPSGP